MRLEARKVGFRYGSSWIFRNLDFSLNSGEVLGLTGPSGSGKTTFARILAGYALPREGTVTIDGEAYPEKGYHPVQLIFQHPEKAINPRWRMGESLREGWEPDEDVFQALGIEKEWLNRWPNELSGGELQRFCVARALGPRTKFIIADEMTTMLDAITQAQIWHFVLDIVKKRNLGMLVVSHERNLINRITDRTIDFTTFGSL